MHLSEDEQEGFAPLCPDFVIELRYRWNTLKAQRTRCKSTLGMATQLAWFIDPRERRVYVYRPARELKYLRCSDSLGGSDADRLCVECCWSCGLFIGPQLMLDSLGSRCFNNSAETW